VRNEPRIAGTSRRRGHRRVCLGALLLSVVSGGRAFAAAASTDGPGNTPVVSESTEGVPPAGTRTDVSSRKLPRENSANGRRPVPAATARRTSPDAAVRSSSPILTIVDRLRGANQHSSGWLASRLGIVLSLFAAFVLGHRLLVPRTRAALPPGAVEVCGRVPLAAKQFVHLVRVGERLLVLLESPQGVQRLAEITDPGEVQRLLHPLADQPRRPTRRGESLDENPSPRVSQVLAQFREFDQRRTG